MKSSSRAIIRQQRQRPQRRAPFVVGLLLLVVLLPLLSKSGFVNGQDETSTNGQEEISTNGNHSSGGGGFDYGEGADGSQLPGRTDCNIATNVVCPTGVFFNNTGPPYDKCTAAEYYAGIIATSDGNSDPLQWTKADVTFLIVDGHRRAVNNTGENRGDDDMITALVDLWPGNVTNETVHLIYRNISMAVHPAFNLASWSRADLWPLLDTDKTTAALTDVHAKAPADSSVLVKKEDLFFGVCGTVEDESACSRPATEETAPTTEQDNKIFAPPVDRRGDVARALFYYQLRYEAQLGKVLSDCPPFDANEFGYLSQLLQWHADDPVSAEEMARNDRACERWQGNRNVFVDYPQLVERYWGTPDTILEGTRTYTKCLEATDAPTATPNACSNNFEPGDVPVFLLNSDEPDQVVFFALQEIDPEVGSLYMTNRPWNGEKLIGDQAVVEFTIPDATIRPGEEFGYGANSPFAENWNVLEDKQFTLDTAGDHVFLYCINADGKPHFIYGFNTAGSTWMEPGLPDETYSHNATALPETLEEFGNVAPGPAHNFGYIGPASGRKDILLAQFANVSNYEKSNDTRFEPQFEVTSSGAATTATTMGTMTAVTALATGLLSSLFVSSF